MRPLQYLINPFKTFVNYDEARGVTYCSFTQRINATAIDMLFFLIVMYPITAILGHIIYGNHGIEAVAADLQASYTPAFPPTTAEIIAIANKHNFFERFLLNNLIGVIIFGFIYYKFWTKLGATPGKWLLGYKIVDSQTLGPITGKQAVKRFFGAMLAALPCMLGFFMVAFTSRNQGLHDLIASTVVIETTPDFSFLEKIKAAYNTLKEKLKNAKGA